MLIWGGVLLGILLVLFFLKPKSAHIRLFMLDFVSILLLLLADVLYLAKVGSYLWHSSFEYKLYRLVSRIPISIFEVKTVVNVAFFLFLFASVLYQTQGLRYEEKRKRIRKMMAAAGVMIFGGLTLLYFNSPRYLERLYIMKHTVSEKREGIYEFLISAANAVLILFVIYTIWRLFRMFFRTKIIFKQQQLGILFLMRTFTTLLVASICAFTPINNIVNSFEIYNFNKNTEYVFLYHSYETLIFLLLILLVAGVAWFGLDILDAKVFRAKYPDPKNTYVMMGNIRHIFHSYKNALLSVRLLIEKAQEKKDTEEASELLEDALKRIGELADKSARVLDIYNQADLQYDCVSAADCIKDAVAKSALSKEIQLEQIIPDESSGFYGDRELITEVLVNLLNNASEALEKKHGEKKIRIAFFVEAPWLCISVRDNGPGIAKKFRNKIFTPAFSTKQTYRNWGMGLAFVRNIVKEHSGYVNMRSRPEKCTEFQVVLPLETEGETV